MSNEQTINKIRQAFKGNKLAAKSVDDLAIRIHHVLMKEYGWIPYREFLELPLPVTMSLLKEIEYDYEEQRKAVEKAKKKRGG
jgi:hypothetical protein